MVKREFQVSCEMLPELVNEDIHMNLPPFFEEPKVEVFPYISEQGSNGRKSSRPQPSSGPTLAQLVRQGFKSVFGESVNLQFLTEDDMANGASDFSDFLNFAWPYLKDVNFLVTHRNFLANEILQRAKLSHKSFIPNAAVIHLRVTEKPSDITKDIYLVRHCTSDHNVAHVGSASLTTCANVDALRQLAPRLIQQAKKQNKHVSVLYGSSVLPRAILSSIALQAPINDTDLQRVRSAFHQPAANPQAVSDYLRDRVCGGRGRRAADDYCKPKSNGTFKL